MGVRVHAGVARHLAEAPAVLHAAGSRPHRTVDWHRRRNPQLPLPGHCRGSGHPRVFTTYFADSSHRQQRRSFGRVADQPSAQQAKRRPVFPRQRRIHMAAAGKGTGREGVAADTDRFGQRDLSTAANVQPDAGERALLRGSVRGAGRHQRETVFTFSPGARGGWNLGDQQLILGAAVPITFADETNTGVFLYLSYELALQKITPNA